MEAIDLERKAHRAAALRTTGVQPEIRRTWGNQVAGMGHELDLMALPFNTGDVQPLQDPTTGTPYFMVGISAVGVDPLG